MTDTFFQTLDRVMGLSTTNPPSVETLLQLQPLLSDPDIEREFWRSLTNPDWLPILKKAGYFDNYPHADRQPDGTLRFPRWEAGEYLVKMAGILPGDVAYILSTIDTDNASVVRDVLNASEVMPADISKLLLPAIIRSVQNGALLFNQEDASKFCLRLIKNNELEAALELAFALFAPEFNVGEEEVNRHDEYWYKEGLAEVAPALAKVSGRVFLPILCEWLDKIVQAIKNVSDDLFEDYSYSWRPAIEEHEENIDYEFAGVMVGIVRAAFEDAIRCESISLDEALVILEKHKLLIFSRLRLHLIAEFADCLPELTRKEMLNRDLFDDLRYKHEIAILMGRHWGMLKPEEKKEWLAWVNDGPDMSGFDELIKRNRGRDATNEDRENRIRWWQYEKLYWIRDHLDGNNRNFYEEMRQEHGEPDLADLNFRTSSDWRGDTSPISVEQLSAMAFENAVEVVAKWTPTGSRFEEPSIDGLSSTFRQYLATNRVEFSSQATILKNRPAIYVRVFINVMIEGVKANEAVDVVSVLDLCRWIIEQPVGERTVLEQEGEGLIDENWQWTRDEVSEFAQVICNARMGSQAKYPLDTIREPIWKLIEALSHDSADSYVIHDLSKDDPRVHDYLFLGSNSPRGKAMRAALEYARWVDNHLKNLENTEKRMSDGLGAMPEFRDMLAWHIEKENRTYEVLSVLGSRINLIYWIDRDWLEANADALFDLNGIEQSPIAAEGWAAWNAFLVWVRPHIEFYRRFKAQFAYAVQQAAEVELVERSREQPMHHLGEHLMLLYGRGELGLDDDGDVLRHFINFANPKIRRHAIGFIGQSLQGADDLPEEVLKRFMFLWEEYWANTGHADAKEKPNARLFGTWFGCGKFPPQWSIDRLLEYVEIAPEVEPDHSVIEHLAEIADTDILAATRILDRMVRGDNEGWRMYGWIESAKRILSLAMQADDQARSEANQLINYLGRRGYMEFGKLLKVQN